MKYTHNYTQLTGGKRHSMMLFDFVIVCDAFLCLRFFLFIRYSQDESAEHNHN